MTAVRSRHWFAAAFACAAGAVACEGSRNGAGSRPSDSADTGDSALRVAIDSPDSALVGQSMGIALTLSNVAHDSAVVTLGYVANRPRVRVTLHGADGDILWDSGESALAGGRPAGQEVRHVLTPGEHLRLEVAWDGRDREHRVVPAGDYVIRGSFFTLGRPINAAPRPLRLRPAP